MTPRVPVRPELLRWACARRGVRSDDLAGRFPKLAAWLDGQAQPTLRQLEAFAAATYTPIGALFLSAPPVEAVPIPDLRTVGDRGLLRPSANLLDTIYTCQQRQDWYRDHARSEGEPPLPFVGSVTAGADVVQTAAAMQAALGFELQARTEARTWEEALRRFVEQAEDLGVLVMVSGIVGTNTRRTLDPEEFRGFALSDPYAPLVFVNGADTKAAQMFTLAHELAHLWAGQTALGDATPAEVGGQGVERWCNRVAAELLVPLARLRADLDLGAEPLDEARRLTRVYKVSTLVMIRRLHDVGRIDLDAMWRLYRAEVARIRSRERSGGGGDFTLSQQARVGRRFARAVYTSTWEGRSSFTEAFRLLDVKRMDSFRELGQAGGAL